MKEIKIISLELNNFKCHSHLKLDFDGRNASVYGDNASGKTSIFDAFVWLLFSKDSKGNGEKNIEVKPLNENGEVKDHNAITEVEAVLSVNGEKITLRRTLKEIWTTRRGHSEQFFDGNTSEYFINGVPVKKNAFADQVNNIIDEDTFRLLTSVSHFADGISWQERRAVLFKVAAVAGDEQIIATDDRFIPLSEGMGKLSVEDYKKKLTADKRGYSVDKAEIPARISECQKTIEDVQQIDFAATRAALTALTGKKDRLDAELIAVEHDSAADEKRMRIREAELELRSLESENRMHRDAQLKNSVDIGSLRRDLSRYQTDRLSKANLISTYKKKIFDHNDKIDACRDCWHVVNNEAFSGGICPTCGQSLPAAQIQAAKDAFDQNKKSRLLEVERYASALKEAKADLEARLNDAEKEVATIDHYIAEKQTEIQNAERTVIVPVDMDGYEERRKALEARIFDLKQELADMMTDTSAVRSNLTQQILDVKNEISARMQILGKESLLEYSIKRVSMLQEEARKAAAALESIDSMLYLIEEYTRYKTKFVEDSINSMFRIAKFRLFREQANGGIEDRCDVTCDGVPYINLNSGAKINAGIDIIRTLSAAYGAVAPLFIDNAESVTHLECSDTQTIRLVVSENDEEVRLSYEN